MARERLALLTVRSRAEGLLSLPRPDDLLGRHVRRGELIGHVVAKGAPLIQVVVPESEADLVLQRTRGVALRFASARAEVVPARIERIAPRLEESVPNPALATIGGGTIPLDPSDPQRLRTIGKFLHLDLALAEEVEEPPRFGERVHVRFAHEAEPLAGRLYRFILKRRRRLRRLGCAALAAAPIRALGRLRRPQVGT